MFNALIQQAIIDHADRVAPQEACGFILADNSVMPCNNVHPDPENYFKISRQKERQAKRIGIQAIYHSHVSGQRDFSPDDIANSRVLQIPYYLYYQPKPEFFYFDPRITQPYEGREFHYAYQNCYELVRDWYRQESAIELRECYPIRPDIWDEPDFDPIALIDPEGQGFVRVPKGATLQRGDVFQIRVGRQKRACHLGVLTDPDRNHWLHHLSDRLSILDVYGADWMDATEAVWRHSTLC